MDPAVGDQRIKCPACHLAPDRIEAGNHDRIGRVVDDDIDAGRELEGADVPALAADDPPLHLVCRQCDGGDSGLGGMLGGEPLARHRDDAAGILVSVPLGLLTDVAPQRSGLRACLVLDLPADLLCGVGSGQGGDALQPSLHLLRVAGKCLTACDELILALLESGPTGLYRSLLGTKAILALAELGVAIGESPLHPVGVLAPPGRLTPRFLLQRQRLLARHHQLALPQQHGLPLGSVLAGMNVCIGPVDQCTHRSTD